MKKLGTKVALLSMPTLGARQPSYQLALLKPTLEREGIDTSTFCMYVYFGKLIGFRLNEELSAVRLCMVGEWLWAEHAFGNFASDNRYIEQYRSTLEGIVAPAHISLEDLLAVRRYKTREFLDFCLERVDWGEFGLIGFSVVFQQMTASLALARALKLRYPHIPIVFGGATWEDDIARGIFEGCDFVDYLMRGDGDVAFPEMIRRLDSGASMEGSPGLMWRDEQGNIHDNGRAPNFTAIDRTPVPDFDEYFHALEQCHYFDDPGLGQPMLPIETARGCWWGEKNHCTFCGLNRAGMNFRAKSPENVLELLQALARKYDHLRFNAIDNIMDTKYIEGLFGPLAEARADMSIHYEVRPHFSREQLARMRQGGLVSVQPGIESFSTHVLELMKKHGSAIRNVSFLKWCVYYGINNLYNILFGFAGETEQDYDEQCELVDKILHFQPPYGITNARPDRGSPMYTDPEGHAIDRLIPNSSYEFIYPPKFDRAAVAYFFEHEMHGIPDNRVYRRLLTKVLHWKDRWDAGRRPFLRYHKSWQTVHIEDGRNGAPVRHRYEDERASLFEFCDEPRSASAITRRFGEHGWVQETLDELVEKSLFLYADQKYLNLVLPTNAFH